MKKAFTINPLRTPLEIKSYHYLIDKNIYQGVEIFYPYNLDIDAFNLYTNGIMEIKNKYENLEFVMHLPYGPQNNLCDLNNYNEIIKIMKSAMDYSNLFGIKKLTLHLGVVDKNLNRNIYLTHINTVLTDLCLYANRYNMFLMIENMPGIGELGYSPAEIYSIIKSVNRDNLKFILDTGHANVSEYSISDYLGLLKDRLFHLHLSDNKGKKDEHARLGTGNIDFYDFLKRLKLINYNELYCLEILFQDYNDLLINAKDLDIYDI